MATRKKNYFKVLTTATLSLTILASTISPEQTSAKTTQHFDYAQEEKDSKLSVKKARVVQKETKNFTDKQREKYYNKVLDKIVKNSKKEGTTELQLLSLYHGLQETMSRSVDYGAKPKEYRKYYHKNPGVQAINASYAESKGYAYALRDLLKKAGFTSYIVHSKEWSETIYWNVIKLGGKYYHLDPYRSDKDDLEKNHDGFLSNGKTISDVHPFYKLPKKFKNTDAKYSFSTLDSSRIVKETKTDLYSVIGIYGIARVSKKGEFKGIEELPQKYNFAAEKNGWLYGFGPDVDHYFYKIKVDDFLYGTGSSKSPYQKVVSTDKARHGSFTLTDKTITFYNEAGKKVNYKLGK